MSAQIEVDNSADVYARRYTMTIVVLGSDGAIKPGETLYLIGHQSRPGQFTEFRKEKLFDTLLEHGMQAATEIVLVGCNTKATGIYTLLSEYLDNPPKYFEEVLLVSEEGDFEVQYTFASGFFDKKKSELEKVTERCVENIKRRVEQFSGAWPKDPDEEQITILADFLHDLAEGKVFKKVKDLTNKDLRRKNGAVKTALGKLKSSIKDGVSTGGSKRLQAMVAVMETHAAKGLYLPGFFIDVRKFVTDLKQEVAKYQQTYQRELIEKGGKSVVARQERRALEPALEPEPAQAPEPEAPAEEEGWGGGEWLAIGGVATVLGLILFQVVRNRSR